MSTASIPRPEYPRPQFRRDDWLCLNGPWQFEVDNGDSGLERGLVNRELTGTITVPFCPESTLSGIGHADYLWAVWYRRTVTVPAEWAGRRALLHFGAVDYDATVWVDGVEVGRHRGGYTPFTVPLPVAAGASGVVVVRARDDVRPSQPHGKQSRAFANAGCDYTRTTGIWQTVWLEPVAATHFARPRVTPDVANGSFRFQCPVVGQRAGHQLRVTVADDAGLVRSLSVPADQDFYPSATVALPCERRRTWSTDDPFLYDVTLELVDANGTAVDKLDSYAGLRGVTLDGKAIKINGKTVFQRLVLDQGFYPDGIYTAPTDQALIDDITLSMAAGFNGARLHQKVFEERFLHHCDRLGYLVWGEFPDWGANVTGGPPGDNQQPTASLVTEWLEAVERDYSHPAIVGWCPLNETWQKLTDRVTQLDVVTRALFLATKAMDTTRPVLDASGYSHRVPETDVWDSHDYEQDPAKFAAKHAGLARGQPWFNPDANARGERPDLYSLPYAGQPYFVSEFGGIWWHPSADHSPASWGYGDRVKSVDEFHARFEGLCRVLLDDPNMFGYCYTQLTDVFQEQNGIYAFDRSAKFDVARIRAAQVRPAAIEA